MKKLLTLVLLLTVAFAAAQTRTFNGHRYEFVPSSGATWFEAMQMAKARGGYLAVVTSMREAAFLKGFGRQGWIGRYRGGQSTELGSAWLWVTQEESSFDNGVNAADEFGHHFTVALADGTWREVRGSARVQGFFVEYEK